MRTLFKYLTLLTVAFGALTSVMAFANEDYIVFGVHSNTAPLEWRANGIDQGFNIELLNKIGVLLNKPITTRRKTFAQLIDDVHNPRSNIDIIAVVTPYNIRRDISQSDPFYATHAKAYTRHGKAFIENWSALEDKRVAIKRGSFVDVFITNTEQNFEQVTVDLYETGFKLLEANEVDVVLAESFVARRLLPHYPLVRSASDPLIFGTFNFVSHPKNAALLHQVNDALRQLKISGEYDRLVNKWFGTGREKVDITTTQQKMFALSIAISIISAIGMFYTYYVSRNLRIRSDSLALELQQREKAEAKIMTLSKQFQAVLDGVPHQVTIFDHETNHLWSNDTNHLLDSGELTYIDNSAFDLTASITQVLASQRSLIADMRYQEQYWQLQIHPIANNQAVVILEENTEQHILRQANDEASRLASLGELSAGIAHEINNPTGIIIHSIALFAQAMQDLQPAAQAYQNNNPFWLIAGLEPNTAFAELEHANSVIEESAKRISRIVNDLKSYALPHIETHHQVESINDIVDVALRLTANQLKQFQVQIDLVEPSPMVNGDAQQLHQVLINLIQNACHACNDSHDTISIQSREDKHYVYVSVSDTGSGMDKATLARITEPFFTTRRSYGGSGLGLSVCSRILKQHQAQMHVSSTLGTGSEFVLQFNRIAATEGQLG